jgi:nucleotide-binding universal stress UspA family protein
MPALETVRPSASIAFKNLLLATDFSPGSDVALKHALAVAAQHSARVHTIHVAAPDCYQLLDPEAFALTFQGWAANSKSPTEVLRGLMQGLPSQVPLHPGQVWQVISEIVERNQIDLLVLASHGRHGIPRLLMGSVAEEVFRNVSCPVLTIGPDARPCSGNELQLKSVLLATHLESNSLAPGYARWLCNEFQAGLTVLHVADERQEVSPVYSADLNSRFRAAAPDDGSLWCKPEFILAYNASPSTCILELAHRLHPDLIVLGARHPAPAKITSHLPWATAARVIAAAPCPVLTVREREYSAD